jgi:hypothetical protein
VTSYVGNPGFTGPACLLGDRQGGHTGTLTGSAFGTCNSFCDVVADCDANGNWTNLRYTW